MTKVPGLRMGSKIVDGGQLIFTCEQRQEFLAREPLADTYLHPLVGADKYINGGQRWVLNLNAIAPNLLRQMPAVMARLQRVRDFRERSNKAKTRELASTPTRFEVTTVPDRAFLAIPEVSSERRDYVPIGWLMPPTIPSNLIHTLLDADLWDFGRITSRMHMAWLRNIGGRLKSDYRYSIGIVYNSFPWPDADEARRANVRSLAQAVLDARAAHPESTLADLYDPNTMPPDLRRAHRALDAAVDKLYRKEPFASDRERVEHLFMLYERLAAPVLAASTRARRERRTRSKSSLP